jgi:lysophospholipase L1-like esterase
MGRRALFAAVAACVATVVLLAVVPGAHAAAPSYVALGDSYSSGTGTGTYIHDGTRCRRSVYAYPSLVAAARGYSLTFRACSGATVADVAATQLGALSPRTAYVTVSVGGNDAGFTHVLTTCAQPAWLSNCNAAIDKARAYITHTLPASLSRLYARIRSRAPNARVVVVGYPRIFGGKDCNALTWFSPTEESRLNATADLLDRETSAAAAAKGFRFANPIRRFTGHAVCDRPEWLNGLSSPVWESFHPNRSGHSAGYTPLVGARLTGTSIAVSAAVLTAAASAEDELAAAQRRYAAIDRTVSAESFRVPDLHSARAQARGRVVAR